MPTHIQWQKSGEDYIEESNYRRFKDYDIEEAIDFFHVTKRSRNKVRHEILKSGDRGMYLSSFCYFISSSLLFPRHLCKKEKELDIFTVQIVS